MVTQCCATNGAIRIASVIQLLVFSLSAHAAAHSWPASDVNRDDDVRHHVGRDQNILQLQEVSHQLNATFKSLIRAKGSACAAVSCGVLLDNACRRHFTGTRF